jgi:4-amino-4-deoxy-L-arabinose transferase-like glycosyltransferase
VSYPESPFCDYQNTFDQDFKAKSIKQESESTDFEKTNTIGNVPKASIKSPRNRLKNNKVNKNNETSHESHYNTDNKYRDAPQYLKILEKKLDKSLLYLTKSKAVAAFFLVVVSIIMFVPGLQSIPPVDRDEARFAQASKQMMETGDYLDIRFQDEARHKKPVGIYWIQVITAEVTGYAENAPIWIYRLPSQLGAILSVVFLFWLACLFGDRRMALLAAVLTMAAILLNVEARLAKTDAMLLASILLCQGILAKAFLAERDSELKPWLAYIFWASFAAGVLIKGPLLPMIVALTTISVMLVTRSYRWFRRLRPFYGSALALVLIMPWFIAIGIKTGGSFFIDSLGEDLLAKVATGKESHGAPPGTYLAAVLPFAVWPLSPFIFLAIPFAIKTRLDRGTIFLACWIIPAWLVFEFTATKLPHYILPLVPALAILAARAVHHDALWKGRGGIIFRLLLIFVPIGLALGLPIGLLVYEGILLPFYTLLALAGGIVGVFAYLALRFRQNITSVVAVVISAMLLQTAAFGGFFPQLRTIWISPKIEEVLQSIECRDPRLVTVGFNEPSLVFLTQTDLAMLSAQQAAQFMKIHETCSVAFIERTFVEDFTAEFEALGISPRLKTQVTGLNINGGDELTIGIWYLSNP